MKRSCLVVILVLGCILAVGAQGHPTGFFELGYCGNGDFEEAGYGALIAEGRYFFKGKTDGLFINVIPALFTAGGDVFKNRPYGSFGMMLLAGGGWQIYWGKAFYGGASGDLGYVKLDYTETGTNYIKTGSETYIVPALGLYLGFTPPAARPSGFSGKAALRGFFMDGEFLPALDISAGFRVGALSGK